MFNDSPSPGEWGSARGSHRQQIDRPSRGSRGASVLETARARSGGGFSGNRRWSCDETISDCRPSGRTSRVRRWWVEAALAVAASVAGSHVSPQVRANPRTTASVRCLCDMPQPRFPLRKGRASRTARIVFRGLAPLAGKGRASARAAIGDGGNRAVALRETPDPGSTVEAARFRSLAAGLPAASSRVCSRLRKGSRRLVLPRSRHHLARGVTGRPSA